MSRIFCAFFRIPQMMGDEFEKQAFRCRPGQGRACGHKTPGFEIAQIGGEGTKRVVAHALLREVFEGGHILVGQDTGQLIAAIERQDGVKRVEFFGTAQDHRVGNIFAGHALSFRHGLEKRVANYPEMP